MRPIAQSRGQELEAQAKAKIRNSRLRPKWHWLLCIHHLRAVWSFT